MDEKAGLDIVMDDAVPLHSAPLPCENISTYGSSSISVTSTHVEVRTIIYCHAINNNI